MPVPGEPLYLTASEPARAYLESRRWPHGPVCPHCAAPRATRIASSRPGLWKCGACRRQFTVTVRTLWEDTKLPLHKWLQALVLLSSSRRGASARELQQAIAVPYQTAWKLLDRVRYAFHRPRRLDAAPAAARPESLYPRSLDDIVDRLLHTVPERKNPDALELSELRLRNRFVK
jgi:transposase-like protein